MPKFISKFVEVYHLWKEDGRENLSTPTDGAAVFKLMYGDLEIGTLSLEEGVWSFSYSQQFKAQKHLKPIVDFPDVNKVYQSTELPPFFAHRIPGLGQPKVQKIIEKEKIDESDELELLKRFGKLSISNPFQLLAT